MKKYLGIDFGDQYIGVALAEERSVAIPYTVLRYTKAFWQDIVRIITDESITDIVVGWPLSMSGGSNERTSATAEFIKKMKEHTELPIYREDERLTSAAASRTVSSKKRVDALAAADILQSYLDSHAGSGISI